MNNDAWKQDVEQALSQVALRSQPAFAQLYDLTSSKLYGLILKIIPDDELAADVLQDSYQKIWLKAQQYRPDLGSAWSWLCQLTRNQAIDRLRQLQRLNEVPVEHSEETYSADTAHLWPEHVDLSRCLNSIRAEQQQVIISAYVHGWSHSELTQKFDTPLGTLKSWIRRGLKELKTCLEA